MKLHILISLVAVGVPVGLAGCVPPQQQQPPAQAVGTATPSAGSASATQGDVGAAATAPSAEGRRVRFNARELDQTGWAVLVQIEAATRSRIPDGDYWYDPMCGAAGVWGGPALAFLPAGLPLGGAVPAQASGGGNGRVSGVFVNGRELHRQDVQVLTQIYGVAPQPGRYWVERGRQRRIRGRPAVRQPDPGRAPALGWRHRRRRLVSADVGRRRRHLRRQRRPEHVLLRLGQRLLRHERRRRRDVLSGPGGPRMVSATPA